MSCMSALFVDIDFLPYGKIAQIGSILTLCQILTLGTGIKKSTGGTF